MYEPITNNAGDLLQGSTPTVPIENEDLMVVLWRPSVSVQGEGEPEWES